MPNSLWPQAAHPAPLSMGFSRQDTLEWVAIPSPGDLSSPRIKPGSPALQADSLPSEPPGSSHWSFSNYSIKLKKILLNFFHEAHITLIPKPKTSQKKKGSKEERKENYRLMSLVSTDAKVLNRILATQIQQYIKGITNMVKWDLAQKYKDGPISANQCDIPH